MDEKIFEGGRYIISYPKGFCEDKKYTLIFFLHGAASRGDTTERLRINSCVHNLIKRQYERAMVIGSYKYKDAKIIQEAYDRAEKSNDDK